MTGSRHLVDRQVLHVDVDDEDQAYALVSALEALNGGPLLLAVERALDAVDRPDLSIRIETLEVDLGDISAAELPLLPERLRRALEAELSQRIHPLISRRDDLRASSAEPGPDEVEPLSDALADQVTLYLNEGVWRGAFPSAVLGEDESSEVELRTHPLDAALRVLKSATPDAVTALRSLVEALRGRMGREGMERLLGQASPESLLSILEQTAPEAARRLESANPALAAPDLRSRLREALTLALARTDAVTDPAFGARPIARGEEGDAQTASIFSRPSADRSPSSLAAGFGRQASPAAARGLAPSGDAVITDADHGSSRPRSRSERSLDSGSSNDRRSSLRTAPPPSTVDVESLKAQPPSTATSEAAVLVGAEPAEGSKPSRSSSARAPLAAPSTLSTAAEGSADPVRSWRWTADRGASDSAASFERSSADETHEQVDLGGSDDRPASGPEATSVGRLGPASTVLQTSEGLREQARSPSTSSDVAGSYDERDRTDEEGVEAPSTGDAAATPTYGSVAPGREFDRTPGAIGLGGNEPDPLVVEDRHFAAEVSRNDQRSSADFLPPSDPDAPKPGLTSAASPRAANGHIAGLRKAPAPRVRGVDEAMAATPSAPFASRPAAPETDALRGSGGSPSLVEGGREQATPPGVSLSAGTAGEPGTPPPASRRTRSPSETPQNNADDLDTPAARSTTDAAPVGSGSSIPRVEGVQDDVSTTAASSSNVSTTPTASNASTASFSNSKQPRSENLTPASSAFDAVRDAANGPKPPNVEATTEVGESDAPPAQGGSGSSSSTAQAQPLAAGSVPQSTSSPGGEGHRFSPSDGQASKAAEEFPRPRSPQAAAAADRRPANTGPDPRGRALSEPADRKGRATASKQAAVDPEAEPAIEDAANVSSAGSDAAGVSVTTGSHPNDGVQNGRAAVDISDLDSVSEPGASAANARPPARRSGTVEEWRDALIRSASRERAGRGAALRRWARSVPIDVQRALTEKAWPGDLPMLAVGRALAQAVPLASAGETARRLALARTLAEGFLAEGEQALDDGSTVSAQAASAGALGRRLAESFIQALQEIGSVQEPAGLIARAHRSARDAGHHSAAVILRDLVAPPAPPGPSFPLREAKRGKAPATHYVENAGIVLLSPFVPVLFDRLGLTAAQPGVAARFVSREAVHRAVHFLQFLVEGRLDAPEPKLLLNKVLCDMPFAQPLPRTVEATEAELEICVGLLEGVIGHWTTLGEASPQGLMETFLQREGRLTRGADSWTLRVERRTVDVLVDLLPWPLSMTLHPWMTEPVHVTW